MSLALVCDLCSYVITQEEDSAYILMPRRSGEGRREKHLCKRCYYDKFERVFYAGNGALPFSP